MEKCYKVGDRYFSKYTEALEYELLYSLGGMEEFKTIITKGINRISKLLNVEFSNVVSKAKIIDSIDPIYHPESCYIYKTVEGVITRKDKTKFNFSISNDESGWDSDQGNLDSVDRFVESLLFKINNFSEESITINGNIIKGRINVTNSDVYVGDIRLKSVLSLFDEKNIEINLTENLEKR